MGQTVVFTVPLDADGEVAIGRTEPGRPPRHPFRRALRDAIANAGWRWAALIAVLAPVLIGSITQMRTGGDWTATAALLTAALTLPTVAAGAAAQGSRVTAPREDDELAGEATGERLARVAVVGLLGGTLALTSVPMLVWV